MSFSNSVGTPGHPHKVQWNFEVCLSFKNMEKLFFFKFYSIFNNTLQNVKDDFHMKWDSLTVKDLP